MQIGVLEVMRPLVLCFLAEDIHRLTPPAPHLNHDQGALFDLFRLRPFFIERGLAEIDERFRQAIPYVLLTHRGRALIYRRTKGVGEARLQGKLSLGFGGHVELSDVALNLDGTLRTEETIENGNFREILEEIEVPFCEYHRSIGLIVSDADAVGRVHVGIVKQWEIMGDPPIEVRVKEPALTELKWVPIPDLPQYISEMEGWAAICAKWLTENFDPSADS